MRLPRPRVVLIPVMLTIAAACAPRESGSPGSAGSSASADATAGKATATAGTHISGAHITGEFLADGSCRVTLDGSPIFGPAEKPRTISLAGRTVNMAPPGHELHELWCSPGDTLDPMIPEQLGDRALLVTLYPLAASAPRAATYAITREIPSMSGAATALSAGLSLFDPAHVAQGGRSGVAYLAADSGSVRLTSVSGARVVGTFAVRAVRAWSM